MRVSLVGSLLVSILALASALHPSPPTWGDQRDEDENGLCCCAFCPMPCRKCDSVNEGGGNETRSGSSTTNSTSVVSSSPLADEDCPSPATCTPPAGLPYVRIMPVESRQQWGDSGGYCGALSIQSIAMSHGAWLSQRVVRQNALPGNEHAHGNTRDGYEILHTNIQDCLTNLSLAHEAFDNSAHQPPMTSPYFKWLKTHLTLGHPVVWMIMCAGDDHDGGGTFGPGSIANYDHVEPVWGIMSKRPLNDTTPYPDDVIVHGADYGAQGNSPGPSLYRTFQSLPDNKEMQGNCKDAQPHYGKNEFYPCVPSDGPDWGYAITGLEGQASDAPKVSLSVGIFDEPDVNWEWIKPAQLKATVTVTGLVGGQSYQLRRWDSVSGFRNREHSGKGPDHVKSFKASKDTWVYKDPIVFESDAVAYYTVAKM